MVIAIGDSKGEILMYLTTIPRLPVEYEMVVSQRGA